MDPLWVSESYSSGESKEGVVDDESGCCRSGAGVADTAAVTNGNWRG